MADLNTTWDQRLRSHRSGTPHLTRGYFQWDKKKNACSLEQNGALTYQRPVEEQRHPDERADAESQDEGPPPAPAQGAAVAGRADQRGEYEAEDGAEEPRQAVVLLGKTCTHKKKNKTRQLLSEPVLGQVGFSARMSQKTSSGLTVKSILCCPQGGASSDKTVKEKPM